MNKVSKGDFLLLFGRHVSPLSESFEVLAFRFGEITFTISSAKNSHWPCEAAFEVKPGWTWSNWLRRDGKVSISDLRIGTNELSEGSDSILPVSYGLIAHVVGESVIAALLEDFLGAAVSD